MNEDKLIHRAQRLGTRAAERLDVEATARGVVERLKAEERADTWRWTKAAWLRIAAVLLVLLGGAVLARSALQPLPTIPSGTDLTGLSAAELQELLAGMDQTLTASPADSLDDLEGLSEEQLRAVLESLEG